VPRLQPRRLGDLRRRRGARARHAALDEGAVEGGFGGGAAGAGAGAGPAVLLSARGGSPLATLDTVLGPLRLANPLLSASGTFGHEDEMAAWIDLREPGMVVLKTVTLHARKGNPPPRIVEVPGGILNSIGLPNEGIDHLVGVTLPRMRGRCAALMVNVAGERLPEFGVIGEKIAAAHRAHPEDFQAIELNLSCPNVESGFPFAKSPELARECVRLVREHTSLPLFAKLSP